jgi:DNA-binding helix-hairpin-helix protein with protein kinase domain
MAGVRFLRLDTGQPLQLGPPLSGATGEGTVHAVVGRPDWAAKVFHPTLTGLREKLAKVGAMVQSPPPGAVQPDGLTVLTWPLHLLISDEGPVGYVMPRIDTATSVELHTMSNPSNRRDPLPNAPQWTRHATWGHLVNVAANLCLAVEVVHRVDAVIGDFQERNILVADTTQVTLVDCDSMQFADRTGRRYLCAVGRPEFTAPELMGVDLRTYPRAKSADLFALAVHIHQLLMEGNHPFLRGNWNGEGNQPDAVSLARTGDWAGGPDSRLRSHPLAPSITFLPNEIQQLFVRALTVGCQDPARRPTAGEWRSSLGRIRLIGCPRNPAHQLPIGAPLCPWCAVDDERRIRRQQNSPATSGSSAVAVNSFGGSRPGPLAISRPPVSPPNPGASRNSRTPLGVSNKAVLMALAAVVVIVVALSAFIIWAVSTGATTFGG